MRPFKEWLNRCFRSFCGPSTRKGSDTAIHDPQNMYETWPEVPKLRRAVRTTRRTSSRTNRSTYRPKSSSRKTKSYSARSRS